MGKRQCFLIQISIDLPLIIFFACVKNILDYELTCNYASNLSESQRPSTNLNESIYSLYLAGEKLCICGFAEFLSPQKTIVSSNRKNI
jgi:hypothetical protein